MRHHAVGVTDRSGILICEKKKEGMGKEKLKEKISYRDVHKKITKYL